MKKTVYQDLLASQTKIAMWVCYTEIVGFGIIISWLYFIGGIIYPFIIVSVFLTIVMLGNLLLFLLYKKIYFTMNKEIEQQQNISNKYKMQRDKLMEQRDKKQIQKKHIKDSIKYAQRIQQAILFPEDYMTKKIPDHFIFFKPKDIISGDFYWSKIIEGSSNSSGSSKQLTVGNDKLILAACDCTGHGVPGALLSMLGVALFNEIISKNTNLQANEILNQLRTLIIKSLHQTGKEGEAKEGIDIALCVIDISPPLTPLKRRNGESEKRREGKRNDSHIHPFTDSVRNSDEGNLEGVYPSAMLLQYAGAYNTLYIIRNDSKNELGLPSAHNESAELFEIKADRMPVGVYSKQDKSFTNHQIKIQAGDIIYIFTDGYVDQFGSNKNKKFKFKRFRELLLSIHKKPMKEQKLILNTTIEKWRAHTDPITNENIEQTDDILVIGMRF